MPAGGLRVDSGAVTEAVRQIGDLTDSLAAMVRYGRADAFTPARLGSLTGSAGPAYADCVDALLTSLERSIAVVEEVGAALSSADRAITEVDADAAARITRAGER